MSGLLVFLTPWWILSSLIASSLLTCSIFSSFVNSLPHMFPFFLTCSFSASCSISSSWVPSLPHLFPLSATCSLCFSPVPSLPQLFPLVICFLSPFLPLLIVIPLLFSHWLTGSCQFSGDLHWCGVPAHGPVVVDQISWIHARLVFPLSSVSHLLYFLTWVIQKWK